MQRRDISAADAPAPAGQYTQAVKVTGAARTLYLSGQLVPLHSDYDSLAVSG
jgi:2-iminobutanoate/2-iminopropanoate deaminase